MIETLIFIVLVIIGVIFLPSLLILLLKIPLFFMAVHKLSLRWMPYRWFINSLIFPFHWFRLYKSLKYCDNKKAVNLFYDMHGKWFSNHWYGRILIRMIENKVLNTTKYK